MHDDADVIRRAIESKNGENFDHLYAGDITYGDYNYDEDAHLALCLLIYHHSGCDLKQTERIYRQSELGKQYTERSVERVLDKIAASYQDFSIDARVDKMTPEVEGRLKEIAIETANSIESKVISEWREPFTLARRLQAVWGGDPFDLHDIITFYCNEREIETDEFFECFADAYDKIKIPAGTNALQWAMMRSIEEPYPLIRSYGKNYARIASISYHLSIHCGDEQFFLPRQKLSDLLNIRPNTVSSVVSLLVKDGIIVETDGNYSPGKLCKKYRFSGPDPAEMKGVTTNR